MCFGICKNMISIAFTISMASGAGNQFFGITIIIIVVPKMTKLKRFNSSYGGATKFFE